MTGRKMKNARPASTGQAFEHIIPCAGLVPGRDLVHKGSRRPDYASLIHFVLKIL
jgi:hypothetical protein